MSLPPRVAFLGTPDCAVPVLRALAAAVPVRAVFCNPDKPAGRGRQLQAPPVKAAAEALGLAVHQPASWKAPETRALWESLGVELAVVVAYGHILPRWLLDSLPLGAWNLHFSILPRWRGAAPVNHAILAGDAETGVALMRLTPGMDEGPVLAQTRRPILFTDTAPDLLGALAQDGAALLRDHLPAILDGTATPREQEGEPTLAPKLNRGMALLDPRAPALELHRRVRALQPWPGTEITLEGAPLKVCGVGTLRPAAATSGTLHWDREGCWLACGDGQEMELTLLQRPGKPVQRALQALQAWGGKGARTLLG
ncbi:MAG: methionyl-tRNA formyltransferase [Acidobacteria bacterium]|nr:methionyl-tRNA formyltransferase [Acidobacteriota bacterium]